ncbi:MAG: chemotaxis protein CheW, partial [Gemmatimonadota bacterium]|nr:chemotaxis protein CheW [Gemmatimonadota bacterium]
VITWEREDWVFPVDEILGIHRFRMDKIKNTPETVAKAGTSYTVGILTWHNRNIGYLDHELVFSSLKRSIF